MQKYQNLITSTGGGILHVSYILETKGGGALEAGAKKKIVGGNVHPGVNPRQ